MSYNYKTLNNSSIEQLQKDNIIININNINNLYKHNKFGYIKELGLFNIITINNPADWQIEYRLSKSPAYEIIKNKKIKFVTIYIKSLNKYLILKVRANREIYYNISILDLKGLY